MKQLMDGKICVITGAGSGIGRGVAAVFAEEGAAGLILTDINAAGLDETAEKISECPVTCVPADLTRKESLAEVFQKAIEAYGRIDVLVCCAGILDYHSCVTKLTRELWDRTIAINQTAVYHCCQEALKHMVPAGTGNIVLVSSLAGVAGNSGFAYTASKYGVIGICKNIAVEYAARGIRCNCVCPGETDTPMNCVTDDFLQGNAKYGSDDFCDKCFSHNRKDIPMRPVRQQADTILFLASSMADGITGQSILVDGGMYISEN